LAAFTLRTRKLPESGDEQIAGRVHCHAERIIQLGVPGQSAVTRKAGDAVPGNGDDDTRRSRHHADPVVEIVGDIEVA
jgi:hypothetical protein